MLFIGYGAFRCYSASPCVKRAFIVVQIDQSIGRTISWPLEKATEQNKTLVEAWNYLV